MPFVHFFDSTVQVKNHAKGGRSTRTFISENRWQPIVDSLQEGDYVFIQFGHNDEAKEEKYKDRYTPVSDYKINLIKFITESRAKKAIPVLITPVARMKFDTNGNALPTHVEYSAAVWEIGKAHDVPVIDLDARSRNLLQQYGPQNSKLLFMHLDSLEHPHYPYGMQDNTHFSDYGARKIAGLVWEGIRSLKLDLASRVVNAEANAMARPMAPSLEGITNIADTSYNNDAAYRSTLKSFPNIKLVRESRSSLVIKKKNINYCTSGNRQLMLDAFVPTKSGKIKRTAVIILHGGGWRSGNRTQHYPLAERLASLGYVCFTPEYRLSTEALYPAAVNDIKSVVQWVRQNAKIYNIDSSKISVLGFSAGGELAAFVGATNAENKYLHTGCNNNYSARVNAVIDIDGTLSFVHPQSGEGDDSKKKSAATNWFGYSKGDNPSLWADASPLSHVNENMAPILFLNSAVDRMHAGRDDFIKVLDKHNIYSEVHRFDNSPHGFCLFDPWFEPTVKYVDSFLKKVFNGK
jgi:acetyl esterase/lipase/lysophospholipase L1-like esterase